MTISYFKGEQDLFNEINVDEQIDTLKSKLKEIYSTKNLCFLLGSGCSLPAIKTMGETFKKTKTEKLEIEDDKKDFLRYFDGKNENDYNMEEYLNWLKKGIDYYAYDKEKQEICKKIFDIVRNDLIKSINVDYFNSDSCNTEYIINTLTKYRKFYSQIFTYREYNKNNPVNIFTTNYDLFNEIALEKNNIRYTSGFIGSVTRKFSPNVFNLRIVDEENKYKDRWNPIRKFVRLYKLHGSIDWFYEDKKVIQKSFNLIQENKENAKVIIYPTLEKHFETLRSPYSELFREMNINLQKPDTTLVIIGYGFSDEHINNLIKQSLEDNTFNLIVFNSKKGRAWDFFEENRLDNFTYITGSYDEELLDSQVIIEDIEDVEDSKEVNLEDKERLNLPIHYFENIIKIGYIDDLIVDGDLNE